MSPIVFPSIPFEPQLAAPGQRACGAAALAMVYRSLGLDAAQAEIWPAIAGPDARGSRDARTHRLAADAISRGLEAVCFEAARPWEALKRLSAAGVRVVLNHRVRADSPLGHFSVLVAADGGTATLHDPAAGPGRRLARGELLGLWQAGEGECEIASNVLVAFGPASGEAAACAACRRAIARAVACPRCSAPITLRPAAALGCLDAACPGRLWRRVFCAACDRAIYGAVAAAQRA